MVVERDAQGSAAEIAHRESEGPQVPLKSRTTGELVEREEHWVLRTRGLRFGVFVVMLTLFGTLVELLDEVRKSEDEAISTDPGVRTEAKRWTWHKRAEGRNRKAVQDAKRHPGMAARFAALTSRIGTVSSGNAVSMLTTCSRSRT